MGGGEIIKLNLVGMGHQFSINNRIILASATNIELGLHYLRVVFLSLICFIKRVEEAL